MQDLARLDAGNEGGAAQGQGEEVVGLLKAVKELNESLGSEERLVSQPPIDPARSNPLTQEVHDEDIEVLREQVAKLQLTLQGLKEEVAMMRVHQHEAKEDDRHHEDEFVMMLQKLKYELMELTGHRANLEAKVKREEKDLDDIHNTLDMRMHELAAQKRQNAIYRDRLAELDEMEFQGIVPHQSAVLSDQGAAELSEAVKALHVLIGA